jgi:hypothetical protein
VSAIYRYEVPVDGQSHEFTLHSDPLAVGCRDTGVVEFWAWHHDESPGPAYRFIAVGTGHPMPAGRVRYHGTAVAPGGFLVWHLIEQRPT